ncbi:hypothetical protein [Burkholderia ubonensis]|uniref:hypothetical protein n=1 Tax=Burkholderia ubonensis TaxID=101571 RepID=UPI000B0C9A04|nr:hypothetical protein [Burkholderia ubonensis]
MPPLTEVELAALDLIIAMKKSGSAPLNFLNANLSVNNLGDVAVAAASVAAVAAAVGAVVAPAAAAAAPATAGAGLSLQELLGVRERAIKDQKP